MATSITFDSEHDLILLEDTDKFRLYIKPDIWQNITAQDVHTNIDNLAKMLWLIAYDIPGITINALGFVITTELPDFKLNDLQSVIFDMTEFSNPERMIDRIKNTLNSELKEQEFRQIDDEFDIRRAMW